MYVKFSDCKIAVASNKAISIWIRSEFYILTDHGLTQIDLPTVKSDIPPIVHLDHVVFATVLIPLYLITIDTLAGDVYIRRTPHSQCFVWAFIVVAVTPLVKHSFGILNIRRSVMLEQLLIHCSVKPFDLTLCLRMLYASVDRQ